MFGNILIVIILISYGCLANLSFKPMPGGDYGVGYSFAWLIYGTGFTISTGLLEHVGEFGRYIKAGISA